MKTIVVLDACILLSMPLCDTLLRIAEEGLYRLHLSQEILDETTRNFIKRNKMNTDECNFTFQDIEKLEKFEQRLDKQLKESISKN